jgi:hypothetical protein
VVGGGGISFSIMWEFEGDEKKKQQQGEEKEAHTGLKVYG